MSRRYIAALRAAVYPETPRGSKVALEPMCWDAARLIERLRAEVDHKNEALVRSLEIENGLRARVEELQAYRERVEAVREEHAAHGRRYFNGAPCKCGFCKMLRLSGANDE